MSTSARDAPADASPEAIPRPQRLPLMTPREKPPQRLSVYEKPPSRTTSTVFPLFHTSLPYALVRDFAYPHYDPLHYGPVAEPPRAPSSNPHDHDPSRRLSDPPPWDASAGPWRDSSADAHAQRLPSISFGRSGANSDASDADADDDAARATRRVSTHRKSKSSTEMGELARGRRRTEHDADVAAAGEPGGDDDRSDSGPGKGKGPPLLLTGTGEATHRPPFQEDGESVPYSPSAMEEHRPESASLDESFAGPSLALYDFHPENDNELALREGQVIQVGYRHGQGWLVAMNLENGEQGLVPEEYVRLLRDIEWKGEDEGDEEEEEEEGEGGP